MFVQSLFKRDEAKSPVTQSPATPTAADLDRPSRTPVVGVRETADAVFLDAELPGVKADHLHLSVVEGVLTLHGQTATPPRSGFQPVHREYDEADFRRAFTLPDNVDAGAISATTKNGVVTITLPKSKASQPRRIAVTTG
jgi:HSP20 family protein